MSIMERQQVTLTHYEWLWSYRNYAANGAAALAAMATREYASPPDLNEMMRFFEQGAVGDQRSRAPPPDSRRDAIIQRAESQQERTARASIAA